MWNDYALSLNSNLYVSFLPFQKNSESITITEAQSFNYGLRFAEHPPEVQLNTTTYTHYTPFNVWSLLLPLILYKGFYHF